MITIVIPTLNEADHIEGLIRQLLADAPVTLVEILIADGGSRDATREIVQRIATTDPRVRLIDNPAKLQAAGVNTAVAAARPQSDIIMRLDAHAGYPAGYIARLAELLTETNADSVVVRLRTEATDCFQKAVAAVGNSKLGTGGAAHRVGGVSRWIDHGHHAAFRRSSFSSIGGYDERFAANEDAELDVRLRRSGGRIWFAADVEVAYYPRRTASALAVQYFKYGAGRARNFLKNREPLRIRQLLPPCLLIGLIIALAITPVAPIFLLIPVGYFGATGLVGLVFALQAADPCLLGAAIALPIMHLTWGGGFIMAFLIRNKSSHI